jgi:ABC-2 type transport system permease protein
MPESRTRHPLLELTSVRIKEFIREPEALFWVFAFPLLLTMALGYAFRESGPEKIPVGVTQGPQAQARAASLAQSPLLQPRVYALEEGREQVRRGKISLLVEGDGTPVYRFDPTRPDARTARLEVDNALQVAAGRRNVIAPREEHVTEQGSRYVDFLVPGLLGMNLMGTGIWGIAFSVVNSRLKKLLKRFVATPMRRTHYLLSHCNSRLIFLVLEVAALVIFAWLVFDVRIRGSILTFAVLCLIGGFTFAAIGILVASRARTIEAVSGLSNLVMLPMWVFSGVFFSYERFPDAVKPLLRALPLTALNDALRAVMNDAAGLVELWPQLLVLLTWGVLSATIGLKIFRWQ